MSISASTNFMSSSTIEAWMETKTDDLYKNMRGAMDVSNTRAAAEEALNTIKAKILEAKSNGGNAEQIRAEVNDTLAEYKDIPEIQDTLKPIADSLNQKYADAATAAKTAADMLANFNGSGIPSFAQDAAKQALAAGSVQKPITISDGENDTWSKALGDTVDGLGKQDQLGLINIQEFNSQINQTKQIASALMDAADKAANAIISHIS